MALAGGKAAISFLSIELPPRRRIDFLMNLPAQSFETARMRSIGARTGCTRYLPCRGVGWSLCQLIPLVEQYSGSRSVYAVTRSDVKLLISSDCQSQIQPDRCVEAPGGRASSSAPGRIGYFIFNEDIGITAYGSAKEPAPTAEARLAAALDMVLRGDKGLLSGDKGPLGR